MRMLRIGAWLALGLCGCGGAADNLNREPVSGKVTFEGEPIARGAIQFRSTSPGAATNAGGLIRDGSYSISRAEGLVPGPYKVMITEEVQRPAGAGDAPGPRTKLEPSRISAEYNVDTKLSAEIKANGPNNFDFDVKKSTERKSAQSRGRPRVR